MFVKLIKKFVRVADLLDDSLKGATKDRYRLLTQLDIYFQSICSTQADLNALIVGGKLPNDVMHSLNKLPIKIETGDYQKNDKYLFLDAHNLKNFDNESFDFYGSCHMLEHTASPINVLEEAYRVLRKDAKMLLIVPYWRRAQDSKGNISDLNDLISNHPNGDHFDSKNKKYLHFLSQAISSYSNIRDLSFNTTAENLNFSFQNMYVRFHLWRFDYQNLLPLLIYSGFKISNVAKTRSEITVLCTK